MNTTTRRLASVVMVMFLALMVSTTWIQFFQADELNDDNRNIRKLHAQFGTDRGPIVVGGDAIALSTPVDDEFGYQREYTDGKLYSPLTGFFSLVNGTTGIEDAKNDFLNGQADALWVDRLQNLLTGATPQGSSVELTIDPAAQKAAWDALGDQRGAVVALDPSTGAILAMVSKPSFDPNELATHDTKAASDRYTELLNDDSRPLISRATAESYPPGSTFKLVTTAAALESGDFTPSTVVDAPSTYTLTGTSTKVGNYAGTSCSGSGEMSLADAVRISCNTTFLGLAGDLGDEAMQEQAEKFGFNEPFYVPFPAAASGYPTPPDTAALELSGIGQGSVKATPLQMAMVSAAIANGGELMEPYSVDKIRDAQLEVVEETSPTSLGQAVSEKTAEQLTDMMVSVVEDGSGTTAQMSGVSVAGKTGTAQHGADTSKTDPHVWFTSFAPADDPKVAVAVVVESGGDLGGQATGGSVAAPIAKAVMDAVLNG
ncbi:penicillin-binding protein 2 [Isoptericola sp. NEAU-Y5]|uniref:Penicillin-binding protein 2 n=1 Tax=Isoptericola luteus TaxID=2879484 RepID=A0ABS7ZIH5_9MICO|nr:penicillin-binding transpeptidase domain-containing protein [Isoptericola sp. NEAU-Y5]MCA5894111.1 penicillin-binding protein 2 [Isoptericola sp. NEAU-Y5]